MIPESQSPHAFYSLDGGKGQLTSGSLKEKTNRQKKQEAEGKERKKKGRRRKREKNSLPPAWFVFFSLFFGAEDMVTRHVELDLTWWQIGFDW
jgi:hypothetical protein